LKEFTPSISEDGTLYVFDKELKRSWPGNPKSVGYQNHFNRVDFGKGIDPFVTEKVLGNDFETHWSSCLRDTIRTNTLPDDDDLGHLIIFVAFAASRVPLLRKIMKESFEADGELIPDDIQNIQVEAMWDTALQIQQQIQRWTWTLCNVASDAPNLICSDCPVCLTDREHGGRIFPYAYGTDKPLLTIPLGKRHALVGIDTDEPVVQTIDRELVAITNGRTAYRASQIYSGESDFVWYTNDGTVADAEAFKSAFKFT